MTDSKLLTKPQRNVGIELLRIVAMLLIVAHHFSVHGAFSFDSVSANSVWIEILSIGGKLGVNIFLLITGYFSTHSFFSTKKVLKLSFEVLFYSICIVLVLLLTGKIEFRIKLIIKTVFPLLFGNGYWFIGVYLLLYCLIPFINRGLKKTNQIKHLAIISLLFCFFVLFPLSDYIIKFNSYYSFSNLGWFIFIYIIGAYLQKYPPIFIKKRIPIIVMTILGWFVFISAVILKEYSPLIFSEEGLLNKLINTIIIGISNDSISGIMPVVLALLMFCSFLNLKICHSKIIFAIGMSTFGVYLIHDNPFLSSILWSDICKTTEYASSSRLIPHSIICIISVFIICSCIDIFRAKVLEPMIFRIKAINSCSKRIDCLMNEDFDQT